MKNKKNIKEKENEKIKKKSKVENENEKKKRWLLLLLFVLFLLFFFIFSFTVGKKIVYKMFYQPSAPVISGGSTDWATKRTIVVVKDAIAKKGLDYYEFCVSTEKSTKNCDWQITKTKNAVLSTTGIYYVTFRGVDKEGLVGKNSNTEIVYIDNNNPIIENIKITEQTADHLSVFIEAKDLESGIETYGYSLDGENYEYGNEFYTFNEIEANKAFLIYIKVVDKVGNTAILSMEVKPEENDRTNDKIMNQDTDDDGVCDFNCDTNGDGVPDINIDTDGDGVCDWNCDTNGDGKPDDKIINQDTNGDGVCDVNCDTTGDNIPDINIDTDDDGVCNWNCDTNGDGKPDDKIINQDPDGDGICDLNCDTTGDNIPDNKIDTDGDGICNINCEGLDITVPVINLDKVPSEFAYGNHYDLPSYYEFGPSGGEVVCTVDNVESKDTSKIGIGTHVIECIAKGNNGISVRVSKQVNVIVGEKTNEIWDGWILLNLFYPDNSTNWEWRIGKEGEIRTGYDTTGWQAYTGPILVKIDDVEHVYIRYDLNGETVIVAPNGIPAVSIEPEKYTLIGDEKTKVSIYYDKNAITKEYKIGDGPWQNYTDAFEVEKNTIIEARAIKEEKVYDNEGNYVYTTKLTGTDSVFISEYIKLPGGIPETGDKPGSGTSGQPGNPDSETGNTGGGTGGLPTPGGNTGPTTGTTSGGPGGTISYGPVDRPDGSVTTKPEQGSKPSTYLEGPMISGNPTTDITSSVDVTITTQEEAEKIYYKVDNGNYKEYTEDFTITTNSIIKAYYIRKSDGKKSEISTYSIKNIRTGNKPYVRIDTNPTDYLSESVDSVEVIISGSDYNTLEYSLDGILYVPYTSSFTIKESATIYARGINDYGTTIEKLVVTTKNAPIVKENLEVSIFANPDKASNMINKTEISINYDSRATKKYYKLGYNSEWTEYTGAFTITENTTIYAYAISDNGVGSATKGIDYLTTGIMSPIIKISPTDTNNFVTVTIDFDSSASTKYYQINGGEKLYYTGPFEVYENSEIYAYNRNALGNEGDSSYSIQNIVASPNYIIIDYGEYYIIKANYPTEAGNREYKWQINGVWKPYDDQGILLVKEEYKEKFINDSYDGVEVTDSNGKKLIFTDHYYILDGPVHLLMENLYLRWDTSKPIAPSIHLSTTKPTKEVEVYISYPSSVSRKYYKIAFQDGTDTGWLEYTGSFVVNKEDAVVYAKGITSSDIESEIGSLKITNIDYQSPEIIVNGDFNTKKQQDIVSVHVLDNLSVKRIAWASGEQDSEYFNTNGNNLNNPSTFVINENGKYTIYAIDDAGNTSTKILDITNIDKTAPNILINCLTEQFGTEVEISIDYEDSVLKEYKIGNSDWIEYTENIIINSYDVVDLLNQEKDLVIYARGTDDAGNVKEVSEIIYLLDTDFPESPIIYPSNGYPTLTNNGMMEDFRVSIVYDTAHDNLTNYYRINDGDWMIYAGPFELENGKVEAKSVKASGLEIASEISFDKTYDRIERATYDNDMDTASTISIRTSKKFITNETLENRKVRFYLGNIPASDAYIKVYNRNNEEIESISMTAIATVLTIPKDAYLVEIYSGSSALSVKEISLREEDIFAQRDLPIINLNETGWASEKVVNITYPISNYQNEYSIDNGNTWNVYTSPFVIDDLTTVIARVVNEEKTIVSSTFTVEKIDIVNPEITLNLANGIQVGYSYEVPTSYKVGKSGGSASCEVDGRIITNTNELDIGNYEIVCTAKNNVGKEKTISKNIKVVDVSDFKGDSLLEVLANDDIITGVYNFEINNEIYPVHVYAIEGDQEWTTNQVFGDEADVATSSTYAQNMVVVKVNGNVTIGEGVTISPYNNSYGGPKGFTLYVTGKLENNGVINNSFGAIAEGQDVYLWKNADGTYEYVPAIGASGAAGTRDFGITGGAGSGRSTGGGGSGGSGNNSHVSGAGGTGTSYSGGLGGNGALSRGIGAKMAGGLLNIYANEYENNGSIMAVGRQGTSNSMGNGGSSAGGSINIFTNQPTGIDQLGIITDARYSEILGSVSSSGASAISGSGPRGGAGGLGTINIGEIRKGQYYDLKEAINQDIDAYVESVTIRGDSILSILKDNDLKSGYYFFTANGENYPVHLYTFDSDQEWTTDQVFGDEADVATSSTYAQNMVVVKVNGNVTIGEGVTISPYANAYGGPKGFTLYVTGKLENNGVINNSYGAIAEGQDVYLWKNADGTYEYVPALGASGAAGTRERGITGGAGSGRSTGGGGSGGSGNSSHVSGAGSMGTSYSGGLGGNGALSRGIGAKMAGGLLNIYANEYENNGTIIAAGRQGTSNSMGDGGSSAGGSINIFTNQPTEIDQLGINTDTRYLEILGAINRNGGSALGGTGHGGGAGGLGTINIGEIRNGQYYDLKEAINQDIETYIESVTVKGDSILSILKDNDLKSGYYYFAANGENYPVHLYTFDSDQEWTTDQVFGNEADVATSSTYAQNMVVVKVNGNVTISEGVTISPYANAYGGPKGFTLYVTGKLENNGVINNSYGAIAEGQDVYLWKNADGTYEYVPALGASGGSAVNGGRGRAGGAGIERSTGGGGAGGSGNSSYRSGAGGTGTSYSGGLGGNGALSRGKGATMAGGLITIYANEYENKGSIIAAGRQGTSNSMGDGGSSAGGSINIFYVSRTSIGFVTANGGSVLGGTGHGGGAGGAGVITYTQIPEVSIINTYVYPNYKEANLEDDYHLIRIESWSTIENILYSLDEGSTWQEYTDSIKISSNTTIQAKGIYEDGSETSVITHTTNEVNDLITEEAFDNNEETILSIPSSTKKVFTISNDYIGGKLRLYLNSTPANDAYVKVFNKTNTEVMNISLTEIVTLLTLPENSYKIEIYSGSEELQIIEINIREKMMVENNTPIIKIDTADLSVRKEIEIDYTEGYKNEYSLDNGSTWQEYTEPFMVNSTLTIFARSVDEFGKVVGSSSFAITKILPTMNENTNLSVGEEVTAVDGSKWHVLEDSESGEEYVTLLSDDYLDSQGNYSTSSVSLVFDKNNNSLYNEEDGDNIGYFLKNIYEPMVKESLKNTKEVLLPSAFDISAILGIEFDESLLELPLEEMDSQYNWLLTNSYWTSTILDSQVWVVDADKIYLSESDASEIGIRPVIKIAKTNLLKEGEVR